MREPIVYGTPVSEKFAEDLANALGCPSGQVEHVVFPDDEFQFRFLDPCRGRAVIVVGSSQMPSKNWELIKGFCHRAKRCGARRIILAIPYFGFARQDYAKNEGESEMMSVRGRELSSFAIDCVILIDLHNPASVSKIRIRGDDRELLSAANVFIPKMRELGLENAIAASPDVGRLNVVRYIYARELKIPAVSGD
ncbi:MAG: ribose-phosphate pyrophosphokinase-like domain-containing protein [Patescibacteria group bacterium]